VAGSPALHAALNAFNQAPAHAPAAQRPALEAAVGAVNSGPLGANAVPGAITLPDGKTVPFNPLKDTAFHALGSAYSLGYVICGLAAVVAALLAGFALGGGATDTLVTGESLAVDTVGEEPAPTTTTSRREPVLGGTALLQPEAP
jgi:hypothetical protein